MGLLLLLCACVGGVESAPALAVGSERPLSEIIGVTHASSDYVPAGIEGPYLERGAREILDMGSTTIKLWFCNPGKVYARETGWPETFASLVDVARHPNYRAVFDLPFKTFILVAYRPDRPEHYWRDGMSDDDKRAEREAFRAFAAYLLDTYRNSGKTFVLQHWEGDWAIRGSYNPEDTPTPKAIDGMTAWLNARQDGVDEARRAANAEGVHVFHAAEVNLVKRAMENGQPNVASAVLPNTHLDLVSYSSWDTLRSADELRSALDFIAAHVPDSAAFGAKNVYIGEFGFPENDENEAAVQRVVTQVVDTARAWRCPYIVYWALYCNESRRTPVTKNDDVRGVWLIKPSGEKAWAWRYFHDLLEKKQD